MSKLVVAIKNPDQTNFAGWKEYRDREFLQAHDIAFQANLFPLGKKSVDEWPDHYKNLFGFGKENRSEYEQIVKNDHFPCLRSAWKDDAPVITICFGINSWCDFENLLKLTEAPEEFDNCRLYKNPGVVLTPFFKYRFMPHRRIHGLAEKLRPFWERRAGANSPQTDK